MKILGINEGHNASASIIVDGKVLAAMSEERITRRKNECGYPEESIAFCIKFAGVKPEELDAIATATNDLLPTGVFMKRTSTFTIEDHIKENHKYWKPVILEKKKIDYYQEFVKKDSRYDKSKELPCDFSFLETEEPKDRAEIFKKERIRNIANKLKVDANKIHFIDHHTAHAAYAYYASPIRDDVLVINADGWGDGANASYGTGDNNEFKVLKKTANHKLATIYAWSTLILGMKPNEHEYKVMGMAPYAKDYVTKKPYEIYASTLVVDGDDFKRDTKPDDMYFWFKDKFEGCRFDGIAAGLQKFTEVRMVEWVTNLLKKTGRKKIVFSGGLALNVKVNKKLAEIKEVEQIHVPPSGGDESLSIGAAYEFASQYCTKNNIDKSIIRPVDRSYLGPEFTNEDVKKAIIETKANQKYEIVEGVTNKDIAKYLRDGKIVGCCRGRMEFGARALGNRSILANPDNYEKIRIINEMIKSRDFWMPFTPSILKERTDDYLINKKKIPSPFMTIGYDSTKLGQEHLVAAIHPYDKTVRPQFVEKEINPEYHKLISEFEKLTGIGALLNTSLNLHGFPIVCAPKDAIEIIDNSKIDMMLINDILIKRKE